MSADPIRSMRTADPQPLPAAERAYREGSGILTPGALLDERGTPDFRTLFGALARSADHIESAVARIRLSAVDLRATELAGVRHLRVLLARLDAHTLGQEADAAMVDPRRARNVRLIHRLIRATTLEVRSAPLGGWAPDFTVFHRDGVPWRVLVGLHWFQRPYPHRGPALASLHGPSAAALAARRFEELWPTGHDIGDAVEAVLAQAERRSGGGGLLRVNAGDDPSGGPQEDTSDHPGP